VWPSWASGAWCMVLTIVASVLSPLVRTVHLYVGRSVVLERLEACRTRVLSVIQNRHIPSHPRLRLVTTCAAGARACARRRRSPRKRSARRCREYIRSRTPTRTPAHACSPHGLARTSCRCPTRESSPPVRAVQTARKYRRCRCYRFLQFDAAASRSPTSSCVALEPLAVPSRRPHTWWVDWLIGSPPASMATRASGRAVPHDRSASRFSRPGSWCRRQRCRAAPRG